MTLVVCDDVVKKGSKTLISLFLSLTYLLQVKKRRKNYCIIRFFSLPIRISKLSWKGTSREDMEEVVAASTHPLVTMKSGFYDPFLLLHRLLPTYPLLVTPTGSFRVSMASSQSELFKKSNDRIFLCSAILTLEMVTIFTCPPLDWIERSDITFNQMNITFEHFFIVKKNSKSQSVFGWVLSPVSCYGDVVRTRFHFPVERTLERRRRANLTVRVWWRICWPFWHGHTI